MSERLVITISVGSQKPEQVFAQLAHVDKAGIYMGGLPMPYIYTQLWTMEVFLRVFHPNIESWMHKHNEDSIDFMSSLTDIGVWLEREV